MRRKIFLKGTCISFLFYILIKRCDLTSSSRTVHRTLYIQRPGAKSDLSQFGKSVSISIYWQGKQLLRHFRTQTPLSGAKSPQTVCVRVQKSVFECSSAGLKTLIERMDEIIDPETDCFRCYELCESCRYLARTQGLTECKEPKNTFII